MRVISFRATDEVEDYLKLLSEKESMDRRPVKDLSALINKIILEHKSVKERIRR